MSTSPEARQAAERIIKYVQQFDRPMLFGRKKHIEYVAGEIDAATVKLREALETMPDPYTENQAFLDWYEDVRSAALELKPDSPQ